MPDEPGQPATGSVSSLSEAAAALVSEHAPVILGLVDTDESVVDIGGALLARVGVHGSEWIGRSLGDLLDEPSIMQCVRRGLAGESVVETVALNGRIWLVACSPQLSPDGTVTGVVALLTFADQVEIRSALNDSVFDLSKFEALVAGSADFIAIADHRDGRLSYLNPAGAEMVGLPRDVVASDHVIDDFIADETRLRRPAFDAELASTGRWTGETELRHRVTGEPIPVSTNAFLIQGPAGSDAVAVATIQRDIRSRVEHDRAMVQRALEQRMTADFARMALTQPMPELLQEAVDLVAVRFTDMLSYVIRASPRSGRPQSVAASDESFGSFVLRPGTDQMVRRALADNETQACDDLLTDPRWPDRSTVEKMGVRAIMDCPIQGPDASWGVLGVASKKPCSWTTDDVAFVESVAATLGAAVRRQDLEAQLQHQALHDPLTGLPNRALVTDRIEQALRRSGRGQSKVAVLLLDLDDFKTINDSLGHAIGDALLAELALRFEDAVREGDTVARLGGDEFAVVCEDVTSEDVTFVAEELLQVCARGAELGGRGVALSASIGVALARSGEATANSLLSEADIAMYRAKRDRPGTYRVFDEPMRGDVLGRLNLAGELRQAVRSDSLDVAYQPIVDLATGRVVGMEALARWKSESGETVPPDVFIPLAEETGLIGEVGNAILRIAARHATTWQEDGEIALRVNASAHELRDARYVDQVLATLEEVGLTAKLLGVELTESMLVAEDEATMNSLTRLRDAGVTLLIDDFGTGYSSLSYLQRFPVVDVLKIDRSFLADGIHGKAVVEAIVALGRAFGLQVCAEGVETEDQQALIVELGCHLAQGYLLSRPVPAEQVLALLAGWQPVLATGHP